MCEEREKESRNNRKGKKKSGKPIFLNSSPKTIDKTMKSHFSVWVSLLNS